MSEFYWITFGWCLSVPPRLPWPKHTRPGPSVAPYRFPLALLTGIGIAQSIFYTLQQSLGSARSSFHCWPLPTRPRGSYASCWKSHSQCWPCHQWISHHPHPCTASSKDSKCHRWSFWCRTSLWCTQISPVRLKSGQWSLISWSRKCPRKILRFGFLIFLFARVFLGSRISYRAQTFYRWSWWSFSNIAGWDGTV